MLNMNMNLNAKENIIGAELHSTQNALVIFIPLEETLVLYNIYLS